MKVCEMGIVRDGDGRFCGVLLCVVGISALDLVMCEWAGI